MRPLVEHMYYVLSFVNDCTTVSAHARARENAMVNLTTVSAVFAARA